MKIEIDLTPLNIKDIENINITANYMRVKGLIKTAPFVEADFIIPIDKDNEYFKIK